MSAARSGKAIASSARTHMSCCLPIESAVRRTDRPCAEPIATVSPEAVMSMVIRMLVLVVLLAESACAAPPAFHVKPTKFTNQAGQTVEAELGELRVPERRGVAGSGTVTL